MGPVKIRISEMLDNAFELIEENTECDVLLDEDRIKEKVFQNIRKPHNKQIVWRKKDMLLFLLQC